MCRMTKPAGSLGAGGLVRFAVEGRDLLIPVFVGRDLLEDFHLGRMHEFDL